MKPALHSKTVWVNLVILIVVKVWPEFAQLVAEYPEISVIIYSLLNIGLRFVTKSALTLLVLLVMVGCSSMTQTLDPKSFYKRDTQLTINGTTYEGVVTVPNAPTYTIDIKPKGEIDLLLIRSCHREQSFEKVSPGWLGKNVFRYVYEPRLGLETDRVCPLRIEIFEAVKGRHSWGLLEFENPAYTIKARLTCNGTDQVINGVGVCQSKKGLIQRLYFEEPIRFTPPTPGCALPKKVSGAYEFELTLGECLYHFDTKDGRLGRILFIGFDGVLVRSEQ